jgi:PAS domain S-box-containing protein
MTLRRSILAFTGGMILVLALICSTFMCTMMMGTLSDLEEAYVHQRVDGTLFYLQEDLSSLKRAAEDWGHWNDTRDFVIGENDQYIQDNLNSWTLSGLDVDFMIYYDRSGNLFYSRAFNHATGEEVPAPGRLLSLAKDDPLIAHSSPGDGLTGIVSDPEGLLLVSSTTILDSHWKGPISGTFIVGRRLDGARAEGLARLSGIDLRMAATAPEEAGYPRPTTALLIVENSDTLIATRTIDDVYGNPTVLLEAQVPREIRSRGLETIRRQVVGIFLASLVFGGLILLFLELSILMPLATITSSVEAIRELEKGQGSRIPTVGPAELATLAESINEMLDHLESYNQKLAMSEKRFRTIVDTAHDCIFIKDPKSRYVLVNPVMERIFQLPASGILGKKDEVLFSPETAVRIREADSRVLSGDTFVGEVSRDTVEGMTITFHVIKVPLRDAFGEVVGICGIAREISDIKQTELELLKRDRLLSASAAASYSLLVNYDIDQIIIDVLQLLGEAVEADRAYIFENQTVDGEVLMSQRYEWTKGEVEPQINNPVLQSLPYHPDSSTFFEIISRGRPYVGLVKDLPESERAYLAPQGIVSILIVPIFVEDRLWGFIGFDDCHRERFWSNGEISVLQVAAGSIGGAFIRSRTRADLVRAKEELQERIGEVEAKNAEMERFVYTVSHDLRSPLVTVQGFVGFLREDLSALDGDKIKIDLAMIEEAVLKMDHLLKDTLSLSRVGRVVNPPEEVSFGEIVHEALSQASGELRSRGIKVSLAEGWPRVRVDRLRVQEALTNLLDNSIKYMGDRPHPEIEVGWRPEGEETVFFVRDNGIGMDPDQREKVFGLFYKIDPDSEGSGVGLAIVRRIIEVHGGRIWIESEEGRGTCVLFTLPTP